MIETATTLGTICHSGDDARDPSHRRVEIWVDADGRIWADRDNPQLHDDAPPCVSIDEAVRVAAQLWGGPAWEFRVAAELDD